MQYYLLFFTWKIMKVISIGKGMYRITVRSKTKRERLSQIPGVHVEGTRVVFPGWLTGNIKLIMNPPPKKRVKKTSQMSLF